MELSAQSSPIDDILQHFSYSVFKSYSVSKSPSKHLNDACFDEFLQYRIRRVSLSNDFSNILGNQMMQLFDIAKQDFTPELKTIAQTHSKRTPLPDIDQEINSKQYNIDSIDVGKQFEEDTRAMKDQLTDIAKLDEMMTYLVEWQKSYSEKVLEREEVKLKRDNSDLSKKKKRALSVYHEMQEFCANLLFAPNS